MYSLEVARRVGVHVRDEHAVAQGSQEGVERLVVIMTIIIILVTIMAIILLLLSFNKNK